MWSGKRDKGGNERKKSSRKKKMSALAGELPVDQVRGTGNLLKRKEVRHLWGNCSGSRRNCDSGAANQKKKRNAALRKQAKEEEHISSWKKEKKKGAVHRS